MFAAWEKKPCRNRKCQDIVTKYFVQWMEKIALYFQKVHVPFMEQFLNFETMTKLICAFMLFRNIILRTYSVTGKRFKSFFKSNCEHLLPRGQLCNWIYASAVIVIQLLRHLCSYRFYEVKQKANDVYYYSNADDSCYVTCVLAIGPCVLDTKSKLH